MNILISVLAWIIVSLPLHEFGHYIAAKRNGWKKIKFVLCKWHGIPYAVAVAAENNYEIKSNKEFFKAYYEISRFYAMGSLFSLIGIWICQFFNIFTSTTTNFFMVLTIAYMMFEIFAMKRRKTNEC